MKIIAKTLQSLENVLAKEIEGIGGTNIQVLKRAVQFDGDLKVLYRANLELRTAVRVLVAFKEFRTKHENHLYGKIMEIDWAEHIGMEDTFAIDAVTKSAYLDHSKYLAHKIKDAIVDQFRNRFGERPNVDVRNPTLRLNVFLNHDNVCKLSFDTSGIPLHKRGYRLDSQEAPINEVLAAGMVLMSGWERDCDFVDPMCGSGTIPIEAALYAHNIAPNLNRQEFGFEKMKNFDAELWEEVKAEARARTSDFKHNIYGFDRDFEAINIAESNAEQAGLEGLITFKREQMEVLEPTSEKGIMVMNPPYDERLQVSDIIEFYSMIGDQLKQKFGGWAAWIISSNKEALKRVGLRSSRKIALMNGSLECKFHRFDMYAGSKKTKFQNKEEEEE
ncbi:MAG: putative N6-adenine-specific DNA methylase [Paraglaciecola sp.]|jgi:putative N6-adenine-specific DNA methylase